MRLPTKQVRVRASGHVCTINVSDFNPAVHAELDEGSAPSPRKQRRKQVLPTPELQPEPEAVTEAEVPDGLVDP